METSNNPLLDGAVCVLKDAWRKAPDGGAAWQGRAIVHTPATVKAVCELYGGEEHVGSAYPLFKQALDASVGCAPPDGAGGLQDFVAIRDVACMREYFAAIGDVSLAQTVRRMVVSLVLMRDNVVVGYVDRVFAGTSVGEAGVQVRLQPAASEDEEVEALLSVTWETYEGRAFTHIASAEAAVDAVDPVVKVQPAHPVLRPLDRTVPPPIRSGAPEDRLDRDTGIPLVHECINVCFNRWPGSEPVDYRYDASPIWSSRTGMRLDLRGAVQLRHGNTFGQVTAVAAALVLPARRFGSGKLEYRAVPNTRGDYLFATPEGFDYALPTDWDTSLDDFMTAGVHRVSLDLEIDFKTAAGKKGVVRVTSRQGIVSPEGPATNYTQVPPVQLFWGCLEAGTPVLMADGSQRAIRDVHPGDEVVGEDGAPVRVESVVDGTEQELVRIELDNGRALQMTANHPVQTQDGLKRADELVVDDTLIPAPGSCVAAPRVMFHFPVFDAFAVRNLVLERGHAFVAEGVVVGDNWVQGSLEAERATEALRAIPNDVWEEADRMRSDLEG